MPSKLFISDQRMLALMEWAVGRIKGIDTETEYLSRINFPRTNISNVRKGTQSFTKEHILNACMITGANVNWIFGIESNMIRKPGKDPIHLLKQAVIAVEQDWKKKR